VTGKEGTSKNASLTKMKSISDGREVEERQVMDPSGTVETNPWSSSQRSKEAAQTSQWSSRSSTRHKP
jgi:hypothetical protein